MLLLDRRVPLFVRLGAVAAFVALTAWVGVVLTQAAGHTSSIWLANGLLLGLVITMPKNEWAPTLLAGFAANVGADLVVGNALAVSLSLSLCNTIEVLVAGWLLQPKLNKDEPLTTSRELHYFALFGVMLAPVVSGTVAGFVTGHPGALFNLTIARVWVPANALGVCIVTPMVLAVINGRSLSTRPVRRQLILGSVCLSLVAFGVFWYQGYPLLFLVYPPLMYLVWTDTRFGPVLGTSIIAIIATALTMRGIGPLSHGASGSPYERILLLQIFLAVTSMLTLPTAAMITSRHRLDEELRQNERHLRSITEHLPALIAHFDANERFKFVNTALGKMLGAEEESVLGKTIREIRGETSYTNLRPHVARALAGIPAKFEDVAEEHGRKLHYQTVYIPDTDAEQTVRGFYAMSFDITSRKVVELKLAASEHRLRTIADSVPALICYLDSRGLIQFCNHTVEQWLGQPVQSVLGWKLEQLLGRALSEDQAKVLEAAQMGTRSAFEIEVPKVGGVRYLNIDLVPDKTTDGKILGLYCLMSDVSSQKEAQRQLQKLAHFDLLTGLPNRAEFNERLRIALARSARYKRSFALLFLDVDHFKGINDKHGHAAGDEVLQEVAVRLKGAVRQTDTVARLAGDEFVIILDELATEEDAEFVARKLIVSVNKPVAHNHLELQTSISIGIAFCHEGSGTAPELLKQADDALYAAKRAGRGTFSFAVPPKGDPKLRLVPKAVGQNTSGITGTPGPTGPSGPSDFGPLRLL